ncbi:MAG TPA: DMT family transporter [Verrucomicrobiae bacterium]|nr:DMT family transporter [Verrucomicrobiae bacterium]
MNPPPAKCTSETCSASSDRPRPLILGISLAAILLMWSLNYFAAKIALRHMDPLSLAVLRIPLAALITLPIYLLQPSRTPFRARDLWTFTYLGFFGVIINQGGFTIGLSQTTSEHAVVIMALGPVLVLILARALKLEALTVAKVLGMAVCSVGAVVLETEYGYPARSPLLTGDLITLASIVGFAICAVLGKRVVQGFDAVSMNTYLLMVSAVLVLPLAVWQGTHLDWISVGWAGWAGIFYMAGVSTVAAYTIFYWVLRYLEPSRVAAVNYVQPVIVISLSVPFLGEHPSWHLLSGGALVLTGVYLAERKPLSRGRG